MWTITDTLLTLLLTIAGITFYRECARYIAAFIVAMWEVKEEYK